MYIIAATLGIGLLIFSFSTHQAFAVGDDVQLSKSSRSFSAQQGAIVPSAFESKTVVAHRPKRVDFERESVSQDVQHLADWIVDSGDNHSMPFMIVDKIDAKVFAFNANGWLRGAAPALLGLARGDDSVPGIGDRKLANIRPEERTTPAGRFVASLGRNLHGDEVLWVDYAAAISLHRVITSHPEQHRLQRLATSTPLDKRISSGCINVPAKFYNNVVSPAFTGTNGIVYVLPETRSAQKVFGSYDVN